MKFGKELQTQQVPEWQEAYMNYNLLKKLLKDVIHLKRQQPQEHWGAGRPKPGMFDAGLTRRVSLYRAFSGLTGRGGGDAESRSDDEEEKAILVSEVQEDGTAGGRYQTMFLRSAAEGGEVELLFFKTLDDELNKVVGFYRGKVGETMKEADELSRQMDALIALRLKVDNPLLSHSITDSHFTNDRRPGRVHMDVIQEVEMSEQDGAEGESESGKSRKPKKGKESKGRSGGFRPGSLEVLDHVKINLVPENPVSTLKGMVLDSKPDLSYNKGELRKAEQLMKLAFVEFHKSLRLLKSYSFLNILAFSKIMKKYDKITSRNAAKDYMEMVEKSYLGSSDEISKLMERVEATFIKHFSNGNRRKGMKTLRPTAKRERHRVTWFSGAFTGFSMALVFGIVTAIQARNLLNSPGRAKYMDNIFPLYSLFGYIVLHMLMLSANIYFWRRCRVNYSFIFGFKHGVDIGYREVLLLSSALSVLTLAGVLANLDMEMDPTTKDYGKFTELVPLGLLMLVAFATFCPFNILYRPIRFFIFTCVFHCICAPLYKVTLGDFFLADQLTSQVQALRSLEFYVCYYGWGDFIRRSNSCRESEVYKMFYFIVPALPYWWRFAQCIRRLVEEKDKMHFYNGLKYLSTIAALVMRTGQDLNRDVKGWFAMAAISSAVATVLNTYWDIVIDWGLLRRNSRNPWLRDKLLVSKKSIYFVAMVVNVFLRLAWMQSVLGFTQAPFIHRTALTALVACLEIIRRGIWNFFRLENEHLNNVGKYRAFKAVPLPFYYEQGKEV
uniref:Uncharacterized protein n=1 Tax=Kalanchoe fedtschenkoi TaxID=63787 RepID=A0A7N0VMR3_KALFE